MAAVNCLACALYGGSGTNTLTLTASGSGVSGTYTFDSNQRLHGLGLLGKSLFFNDMALITFNLTAGDDTFIITGTPDDSQVTVNGFGGQDTITVHSSGLNSQLTLNGGDNNDTFVLDSTTHSLDAFQGVDLHQRQCQ